MLNLEPMNRRKDKEMSKVQTIIGKWSVDLKLENLKKFPDTPIWIWEIKGIIANPKVVNSVNKTQEKIKPSEKTNN